MKLLDRKLDKDVVQLNCGQLHKQMLYDNNLDYIIYKYLYSIEIKSCLSWLYRTIFVMLISVLFITYQRLYNPSEFLD